MVDRFDKMTTSCLRSRTKSPTTHQSPVRRSKYSIASMHRGDIAIQGNLGPKSLLSVDPILARITIENRNYVVRSLGRYSDDSLVGAGSNGRLLLGAERKSSELAIKVSTYEAYTPSSIRALKKEARLQSRLEGLSDFVLGAKQVREFEDTVFIVMEYIKGGDLLNFIQKGDGLAYHKWQITSIIRDAAEGVEDLHNTGIAHGDLKLETVLCRKGRGVIHNY